MTVAEIFETLDYGPAPESPDPARAWLERHGRDFGLFIGGRWVRSEGGESFETFNPASGEVLARITQASGEDVDAAVAAARQAQPGWWKLGGHGRARYLYALARHVQKHSRLLAVLETMDNGKPIRETRDIDVPLVARHFYYHAGWAQLLERELPGQVPVGVAGQVIPWNFPLLMLAWKIAPALACGNTVVLKPAEFTPLTALAFAELCQEVGLPPGVVNIVTGDGRTGEALVRHPDVDKVAFTGSTEVGRLIRQATAGSGKKLSLELGGKSPFVVFEDADLDSAVEGVVDAIWFNQGQVCCAGSRLLVHEGIAERMYAKLRARMETMRLGQPLDKAVDLGAIIAPVQLQKIRGLVAQGVEEGARCWQPSWACPTEGWFYPPTLFTEVSPSSTIAQVEIFGPVLVAMTFRTPAEAVELANNTPYGLAASVWTESVNLALDVAPKLKAGVVWINCTNLFDAASGFGGYRESGFGREGGREGLWEYVRPAWEHDLPRYEAAAPAPPAGPGEAGEAEDGEGGLPAIDRTPKLYIGGQQARPDSGYSLP
ncbi:MAG: aldehyde dehydrogenase family protein, partial [Thermoanaerobaculia bacterium]